MPQFDPAALTLAQCLVILVGIAFSDWITAVGLAIVRHVFKPQLVLDVLFSHGPRVGILLIFAVLGKGIPAVGLDANPFVFYIFDLVVIGYVVETVQSIKDNFDELGRKTLATGLNETFRDYVGDPIAPIGNGPAETPGG